MRKNLTLIGFLVLIAFGMAIFTGCAENKTSVKDEAVQEQKADAVKAPADQEQSAKVEAAATTEVNTKQLSGHRQ